ncbi:ankyrin repeat domain protein [Candidatus Rickettsiella viridis]|uniref:Ankyrin repeat domain protein n=1 Tax=Candidatus Rickettsiella viridis TaxID=676208 RepID=A0A2Z5UXG7_9COXI|nr:ankyrin repeat domain-containing protein [Candidatus Rickettsiella viridis]BBB15861.1 ankyrin repeat domain protein [Candidatus Rickettsiella viridis]
MLQPGFKDQLVEFNKKAQVSINSKESEKFSLLIEYAAKIFEKDKKDVSAEDVHLACLDIIVFLQVLGVTQAPNENNLTLLNTKQYIDQDNKEIESFLSSDLIEKQGGRHLVAKFPGIFSTKGLVDYLNTIPDPEKKYFPIKLSSTSHTLLLIRGDSMSEKWIIEDHGAQLVFSSEEEQQLAYAVFCMFGCLPSEDHLTMSVEVYRLGNHANDYNPFPNHEEAKKGFLDKRDKKLPMEKSFIKKILIFIKLIFQRLGFHISAQSADDKDIINPLSDSDGNKLLGQAIVSNCVDAVKALMVGRDLDSAINENGDTALYIAASKGRADIVEELLVLGCNPNAKNKQGYTPLCAAVRRGDINILTVTRQCRWCSK